MPDHPQSEQAAPAEPVRLLVTVHGIRTYGKWQEALERLVHDAIDPAREEVRVFNYKYGYFSILAFALPPLRWLVTRRFRAALCLEASRRPWARIDVVAHSFGTHLVAWGLYGLPPERRPKINTLILAGSVLRATFRWGELLGSSVARVVNDCGTRDNILLLNQLLVLFSGMAGRTGFAGMTSACFRNRFFRLGHSGYFLQGGQPSNEFMRRYWVPLLVSHAPISPVDSRSPSSMDGLFTFALNNAEPLKLAAVTFLFALVYGHERALYLESEGRRAQAAQATKAAQARLLSQMALQELNDLPDRALILAVLGYRYLPKAEGAEALYRAWRPRLLRALHGHSRKVSRLEFSADGRQLASGADDDKVVVWTTDGWSKALEIKLPGASGAEGLLNAVNRIGFDKIGRTLALDTTIDDDVRFELRATAYRLVKARDDRWGGVAAPTEAAPEILWNGTAMVPAAAASAVGYEGDPTAAARSPNGKVIVTGLRNGTILVWDAGPNVTWTFYSPSSRPPSPLVAGATNKWGDLIAATTESGEIGLWDTVLRRSFTLNTGLRSLVSWIGFSSDGQRLVAVGTDGVVVSWRTTAIEREDGALDFGDDPALCFPANVLKGQSEPWSGCWEHYAQQNGADFGASYGSFEGDRGDMAWRLDCMHCDVSAVATTDLVAALGRCGAGQRGGAEEYCSKGWVQVFNLRDLAQRSLGREPSLRREFVMRNSPAPTQLILRADSSLLLAHSGGSDVWVLDLRDGALDFKIRTPRRRVIQVSLVPPLEQELAILYADGEMTFRDVNPARLADRACTVANGNLSDDEWRERLGDVPTTPACPGKPVIPLEPVEPQE